MTLLRSVVTFTGVERKLEPEVKILLVGVNGVENPETNLVLILTLN